MVGEILVKFHPIANNNLVDILEREGAEAVVPDLTNFFLSCAFNTIYKHTHLEGSRKSRMIGEAFIYITGIYQRVYKKHLIRVRDFMLQPI
ncbi:hypothetical protein Q0Y04_12365 [Clostridioides difficile]|nr:hypothetical protein Q0Y04_12365 [Clostridioides difficile]